MNVSKSVLTVAATLCGLLCGCGGSSAGERSAPAERATRKNISLIEGVSPLYGATVPQGSVQRIGFRLRAGAEADSVVLYMGERRVAALDTAGYPYEVSAAHPTGKVLYKVVAYREGRSDSRSGEFAVLAGKAPVLYGHRVRNVYPHDRTAYTQGLLWHDGYLYESTGLEGGSTLRQVDLTDGRVVRSVPLDDSYFGEGLALLGGKLYQLTWRSNKGFVYDLKTFERVGEFGYGGEGWGLATDGTSLYQSDGTEKIRVIDPETFRTVRTIEVCTDRSRVPLYQRTGVDRRRTLGQRLYDRYGDPDRSAYRGRRRGNRSGGAALSRRRDGADRRAERDRLRREDRTHLRDGQELEQAFRDRARQTVTPDRGTLRVRSGTIRTCIYRAC